MSDKKYTIKDIANLSGISKGTVDRVLHGRGKVSEAAANKVNKVLAKIDYKPNIIARTLKQNKTVYIATLIPLAKIDSFWENPTSGITDAANSYASFGVSVVQHFYDPHDKFSFEKVAQQIIDSNPDGVLVAVLFQKEALYFFKKFKAINLPFVSFNTDIAESQHDCFIGQDLYQSGRIAADLIFKSQKRLNKILIFHLGEESSNSPHMLEKERGFKDYFEEIKDASATFHSINLIDNYDDDLQKILKSALSKENVNGIFVTTSRTYQVAKLLNANSKNCSLVGYDLVQENIKYLKSGRIDFLINQNPRKQAIQGIHYLTDLLVFKKEIPKKELLPIDIITKENINSYHLYS